MGPLIPEDMKRKLFSLESCKQFSKHLSTIRLINRDERLPLLLSLLPYTAGYPGAQDAEVGQC